ncbi:MBOAT family O-acyltransferase [Marinicrinis lubricantis]|uniref:MBOAT family O-acyltransferase n=1 Tax=Marinicrinis lubricantis TaxID=2086470 RepID=A0ABW1IM62_9BACL
MLFNTYEFILVFLPITVAVYFILGRLGQVFLSKAWLAASSLFFYSYWDIRYLPLLLGSILFNFAVGSLLARINPSAKLGRKLLLTAGIVGDVLLLGYYKYADFFIENVNAALGTDWGLLHVILPLGISFFTFTQIAYLVDAYRLDVKENNIINYTLFVTFYPHLIAGPILHHKEMMPQFADRKNKAFNFNNLTLGTFIFVMGLAKKVIIADTFAPIATAGFDTADTLTFFDAWATSLAYTLQLYFDFSGYSDMAIGAALMFNVHLPINFDSPYKSLNIQEFWRRWHITLGRFLRNYIYIPLGGNRKGFIITCFNLFITFVIGGIWHGAGWTFLYWGALHGGALVVHRIWSKKFGLKMNKYLAWFLTFNFVNIAWIFFRATSLSEAMKVLKGMFGFHGFDIPGTLNLVPFIQNWGLAISTTPSWQFALIAFFFLVSVFMKNTNQMRDNFKPTWWIAAMTAVIFVVSLVHFNQISEFLYFNF